MGVAGGDVIKNTFIAPASYQGRMSRVQCPHKLIAERNESSERAVEVVDDHGRVPSRAGKWRIAACCHGDNLHGR